MTRWGKGLLFYEILVIFDVSIAAILPEEQYQSGLEGEACVTYENKPGICTNWPNCKTMRDLVTTGKLERNAQTEKLFRDSKCGWNNNEPKVCCSDSTSIDVVSTPSLSYGNEPGLTSRLQKRKPAECGKPSRNEVKIYGGKPAELGSWPWMVALGYRKWSDPAIHFRCGATLIADEWLLTAAHCVMDLKLLQLTTARLGDLDLNDKIKDNATPVDVPVENIIVHPNYNNDRRNYDISLIRLKNPVKFSTLIQPICLLSGKQFEGDSWYKNKKPYAVGWGVTENGTAPTRLYEVPVPVTDLANCSQTYLRLGGGSFTENLLCAGQPGKDSCQGDSGGPLIFIKEAQFYLGGVVSAGKDCATKYPGLYTRVARFISWINDNTGLDF